MGFGDGCPAVDASFNDPSGVAVDSAGNVYIADMSDHEVRKITASGGSVTSSSIITAVAGDGTGRSGCNGQSATSNSNPALETPTGVAVDLAGNIYIADPGSAGPGMGIHICRVTASTGEISTVAGDGTGGFNGNGTATNVELNNPQTVAVNANGSAFYIADEGNNLVRVVGVATVTLTGSITFNGTCPSGGGALLDCTASGVAVTSSVTGQPVASFGFDPKNASTAKLPEGSSVVLTADPCDGNVFESWSGACSGTSNTCSLTLNANTSFGALFFIEGACKLKF
jgi:Divergent InlB B-repeat domain/NHL repeat